MIAPPPTLRYSPLPDPSPSRAVDLIVIHCSATASGKRLGHGKPGDRDYQSPADVINAWHAARGFKRSAAAAAAYNPRLPSIGYHFVIDLDGSVWTGRHLNEVPAQAAGFNANAVGICLVGGVEPSARYTSAQWTSLAELVVWLLATLGMPAASPLRTQHGTAFEVRGGICGHRDLSPDLNGNGQIEPAEYIKTCPGFSVADWLRGGMQPLAGHIVEA